ncbi:mRNA turnover protein 4-like protein [Sciurus carolinensis]|uniref:mRNA turnover protein 4-like protein n=1 Tax=Sciurus carolinensis TaxID=30640 RepID=A0AA41MP80_SCICA|nr:mRNA turnover protein 4-like protein [Sciurus carolinensis]
MRNSKLKDIRNTWKHSCMFFGKNKVMMVALGRILSDEDKDNLHQLRQLGLPTALKRSVVTLLSDYKVCKEGDVLTLEQACVLKLFEYEMAEFKVDHQIHVGCAVGRFQQMGDDLSECAYESSEESEDNEDN